MANRLTEDQIQQVLNEFHAGGKIAAIKLYRKHAGCSLLRAKDDVEALAAGRDIPTADIHSESDGAEMDEILDLIQAGKKLNAVKVYMTNSGLSLKESKEFIEKLMQELEVEQPGSVSQATGCSGVILLAIVLAASIVTAAISIA